VREASARAPGTAEAPAPALYSRTPPEHADSPREHGHARRRGLPRGLWLGCAAAAIIWQAATGRPGIALLLLAAGIPLVAIPRHSAGVWLLAALAPVLGLAGLAGAFPAIAGQLRSWQLRAALGSLGYWWLTLAQPLAHTRLWLGTPSPLPPRHVWESSLSHAVHVLSPMLSVGVLLGAGAWAAAALVLPLLARGRSALADALVVAGWSVALVLAARALDGPLPAGAAHASPRGAVIGALLGAAIALGARALRGPA
jgi:eukaryotic-like serine/threonine-protein kinase